MTKAAAHLVVRSPLPGINTARRHVTLPDRPGVHAAASEELVTGAECGQF
jgi:hypothetical protein